MAWILWSTTSSVPLGIVHHDEALLRGLFHLPLPMGMGIRVLAMLLHPTMMHCVAGLAL